MNWRKKWRAIKYKLVRSILTDEEQKVLFGIRMGYLPPEKETEIISYSFILDNKSHRFLHSADGIREFDAINGAASQLLKVREKELSDLVTYTERFNEESEMWICTSKLEVVRRNSQNG